MYESWGCITVRYTSPSRCLYLDQGVEGGRIARRLASLLSELCVLDNPIIVHCLEVNGVNMYVHLRRVRINKIGKLLVPARSISISQNSNLKVKTQKGPELTL